MAATQQDVSVKQYMNCLGEQASAAARLMSAASTANKNNALIYLAELLLQHQTQLMQQNQLDLSAGKERGLEAALLDRLELTPARIESMAEGLQQIASLQDPVGEITDVC